MSDDQQFPLPGTTPPAAPPATPGAAPPPAPQPPVAPGATPPPAAPGSPPSTAPTPAPGYQPPTPAGPPPPGMPGAAPPGPQYTGGPQNAAETWAASTPPQQNATTAATANGVSAGFWPRVGARLIDGLIIGMPTTIVGAILLEVLPREDEQFCTIGGDLAVCRPLTGTSVVLLLLVLAAIVTAIVWFWHGLLVGMKGQTPGRKALGLRVVDRDSGGSIGRGRGIARGLMGIVSGVALALGHLWSIWDSEKQTWHDKVASSIVIKE